MTPNPQTSQTDEQQIRALIDAWVEATHTGDLIAQMNLMTEDVVFLTAGSIPMRRDDYASRFRSMIAQVSLRIRSNPQEITITGDTAICWNLLEVSITPLEGGDTINALATHSPFFAAAQTANGASGATPTCSPRLRREG
jgi:uncharacterized protein (TIGR02246 family)